MEGLLPDAIQTIEKPSVPPNEPGVRIKNVEYIGSFNWVDAPALTLMVPGSPPEWLNKPTPYRVPHDTGICFVDQTGYRLPSNRLLPLFVAIDTTTRNEDKPEIDWTSIDFISNRNGLRKLLRWISGERCDDFRIDLQLAGKKAVLFSRWEKRSREQSNPYVFSENFKKMSTAPAPGCSRTSGHSRIIQYDMSGLNMIVGFDVDAYLPQTQASKTSDITDLADALAELSVSTAPPVSSRETSVYKDYPDIQIIRGGRVVPQSQVLDTKTLSKKKALNASLTAPYCKMWLSQTPNLVTGIHTSGHFIDVEKRKLRMEHFANADYEARPHFQGLRRLMGIIQAVVVEHGERGTLSLVCRKGKLEVFERSSSDKFLTGEILNRFE